MIDYATILSRKYNAEWLLDGDSYEGLTWLSDSVKPSKEELDALWSSVEKEIKDEQIAKSNAKKILLERLGITEEEARLLLA